MSDLPIWAQDRAREWLVLRCDHELCASEKLCPECSQGQASLAALLVEVEEQEHACGDHIKARLDEQMAEVRRVVGEVKGDTHTTHDGGHWACEEILARLGKL